MRNIVSHGYFKVDHQVVWKTIRNDLPALHRQVLAVAETLRRGAKP